MNKAILVTFGLFALMNTLESLISRQATEIESHVPAVYDSPADSTIHDAVAPVVEDIVYAEIADTVVTAEPVIEADPAEPSPEAIPQITATSTDSLSEQTASETSVQTETTDAAAPVAVLMPSPDPSDELMLSNEPEPDEPAALSAADSLLLLIPELAWPDSHRTRRVLTPDIAHEHPDGKFVPRSVTNTVWGVGEYLEYSIDYGFYTAGTATMSVLGTEMVNGAPSFHIQTTARSNDFISRFYKVRDQVNSYIDTQGIFSRRIEKILREGDYHSDRFVDFYPDRQIAVSTVDKHAVTEIPLYMQDVLSSLYLIRTYPLEVGKDFSITTYADGKVYPLKVTVHKMETISVPAGKFRCYVVEPFLQSDGIFRQKGKLTVWLTADEHRIPVKMTSKIVIGSIGTNLTTYRLGATE